MTHRKHPGLKERKAIGEVAFPIETLIEARMAGYHCRHIETDLEAKAGFTPLIKSPSHVAVMGKDPSSRQGSTRKWSWK